MTLAGKVALVTGSSHGIGRACALALAEDGAAVVVNYHLSEAEGKQVAETIQASGRRSIAVRADVTKPDGVEALFRKAERELGGVDVLVNNVGAFVLRAVADTTGEDWRTVIDSNVYAAFLCSKAALPGMRERRWGRIVNITVAPADRVAAAPATAVYQIAKTGMLFLAKALAIEEARNGITVNSVGPGLTHTERMEDDLVRQLTAGCPMGRMGRPEEIGRVVVFLAQPESEYITGAHIPVAGAWEL